IDHFFFQNVADDFAVAEDHALAVASGDADVSFARFTGTVDDAAEHADFHRLLLAGQALFHLGNDLLKVDGEPATGGAGDQLRLAHAPAGGLKNIEGGGDFWDRVAQKADTN